MKNRKTAKIFVVAMLLISICLSSVVSVFASSGTASESTEGTTVTTKYGTVPAEYQDKTFVAFSEGVCIGASDVFNGKQSAESIITLALGANYTKAGKNYTTLIYFPEIGFSIEELATNYALNGVILIRPYARGSGESEGVRDFGGNKDLSDSQKLLRIFDSASFIEKSKIFVAG